MSDIYHAKPVQDREKVPVGQDTPMIDLLKVRKVKDDIEKVVDS